VKHTQNAFNLKVKLNGEWLNEKVFLYFKQKPPWEVADYKTFALLVLLIANIELMLDDIAEFMEEYRLRPNQLTLVSKYMKELQYISNRKLLEPILLPNKFEEGTLIKGLFSSFLKLSEIEGWDTLICKTQLSSNLLYSQKQKSQSTD